MAIALETKFYHVAILAITSVLTTTGFNITSSLKGYFDLTAVNVVEERAVFDFRPNHRPPKEGDGGSRWVPENKT
ncbi:MAG: hypothetical protein SWJ54_13420 [Cyanobacteriota bacterium]|nr:hypothetical protein [Cyanobacteriota bacterium]